MSLVPGTYLVKVSKGSVFIEAVINVSSSSSQSFVIDATATAVATLILAQSGSTGFSGVDVGAYYAQGGGSNATFTSLVAGITNAITQGLSYLDATTGLLSDTTLSAQGSAIDSALFTVLFRYPTAYQTDVHRNGPIAVAFNKSVQASCMPPTYTAWSVSHVSVTTGQTITIDNTNYTQYGTWSYSDSPQTVNGVALPAHCLNFVLNSQSMVANSKEVFTWTFNALPVAQNSTPLTLVDGGAHIVNNLTFYTGSSL